MGFISSMYMFSIAKNGFDLIRLPEGLNWPTVGGGGGKPQFPFLAQIYQNLSGPQITQKLTQTPWKYNFLSHFFVIFRPFRSLLIQWVQGVWFLIILRAFYIKMSRVAFTHFCR